MRLYALTQSPAFAGGLRNSDSSVFRFRDVFGERVCLRFRSLFVPGGDFADEGLSGVEGGVEHICCDISGAVAIGEVATLG